MIYTVTLNPAIDLFYRFPGPFRAGEIHRAETQLLRPGGKGVNTAIVLHRLGIPAKALGFAAGQTGELFLKLLDGCCDSDFVLLSEGETRINAKIEAKPETAVNGPGPVIDETSFALLLKKLNMLTSEDILVLSGKGAPNDFLRLGARCAETGAKLVVDTSGEALRACMELRPWLIKPNAEELAELLGCPVPDTDNSCSRMEQAQAMGAQNVLLSRGAEGAMLLCADGALFQAKAEGDFNILSTVGAGDSLTAGFLAAKEQDQSDAEALCLAVASGTAAACDAWLPGMQAIRGILPCVRCETY